MRKINNLTIIGTSHISIESVESVKSFILKEKPSVVAVELDRKRLDSLLAKDHKIRLTDIRKIGVKGFLFVLVGSYIQNKLAKMAGTKPGDEMLAAVEYAKKVNAKIALIDQDVVVTLSKFSKRFTWKEKFRVLSDLFRGIFFGKRELRRLGISWIDLRKVPAERIIKKLVNYMKQRYPSLYLTLIEERNQIMAEKLIRLMNGFESVLAVVGAGHEEGIYGLVRFKKEERA